MFVAGSLDGHADGVHCLKRHPTQLSLLISGSYDGEVRLWDLPKRECRGVVQAHSGFCRGIAMHPDGDQFLTVGDDKSIKIWQISSLTESEPNRTLLCKHILYDISHHETKSIFATCGEVVSIWDETRDTPIREYQWGVDTVHKIAFNPVENEILGAVAQDRSILLYDCRDNTPLRKVIMKLRSNALAWNPMEPMNFVVANEDYNAYTFDMRYLKSPKIVHMDHTEAIMDVNFSPTGREFVTGSYDKTIRIFPSGHGRSREVYHTKRMQRVMCVSFSGDARFVMSGSDEMNIRVWKTNASEKLGPLRPREAAAFRYAEQLKERFKHHPEVRRIARHRHVPKHVYTAQHELKTIRESKKRKEANRRAHSKPGAIPFIPEKRKHTVEEQQ